MKNHDKDFEKELKNLIENNVPDLPDSLSQQNIVKQIKGRKQAEKKPPYKKIISIAASFVIVLAAVLVGTKLYKPYVEPVENGNDWYEAVYTSDYKSIEDFFVSYRDKYNKDNSSFLHGSVLYSEKAETSANSSSSATDLAGGSDSHSETDLQVSGVDEADIIKNDGNYLYTVSQVDHSQIYIIDTSVPGEIKTASVITISAEPDTDCIINEIYISGDKLIAIVSEYVKNFSDTYNYSYSSDVCCYCGSEGQKYTAVTFDISDRSAPKETARHSLDGSAVSSRLIGSELYLISNYFVPLYNDDDKLKENCIPSIYKNGEKFRIVADNINIINGNQDNTYAVLLKVNIDTGAVEEMSAILGGTNEIYCTEKSLYLARTEYTGNDGTNEIFNITDTQTKIFSFDIQNDLKFKSKCIVDGEILNQFSMDEYNGYFRIATSLTNKESIITVLSKDLSQVGEIRGIAKDESIYAVRFIDSTAYVITYRQTDPLFVIDLSDPSAPQIKGQLSIPGFSNMLYPYSDTLLIGIGYDGTDSGATNNLKISLFDISNPENPLEISKAVINAPSSSPARYNHKAFTRFGDTNEFMIPVSIYSYERGKEGSNALYSFRIENNKLVSGSKYESDNSANHDVLRGAYTGNSVFSLTNEGVTAFDKSSGNITSEVTFTNGNAASYGKITID